MNWKSALCYFYWLILLKQQQEASLSNPTKFFAPHHFIDCLFQSGTGSQQDKSWPAFYIWGRRSQNIYILQHSIKIAESCDFLSKKTVAFKSQQSQEEVSDTTARAWDRLSSNKAKTSSSPKPRILYHHSTAAQEHGIWPTTPYPTCSNSDPFLQYHRYRLPHLTKYPLQAWYKCFNK